MLLRTSLLAAAAAAAVAGCGSSGSAPSAKAPSPAKPEVSPSGDIPDNQAYVPYAPAGAGVSVKVPEGWSRSAKGGATTFTDNLNTISMTVTRAAAGSASTATVRSTLVPRLRSAVPGFQLQSVTTVHRQAGTAVRIAYLARGRANAVTARSGTDAVEQYLFVHGGRELVLTLSGPKGADNVDPWKLVTNSVRWTR